MRKWRFFRKPSRYDLINVRLAALAPTLSVIEILIIVVLLADWIPYEWRIYFLNDPAVIFSVNAAVSLCLVIIGIRGLSAGTVRPLGSAILLGMNGMIFALLVFFIVSHLPDLFG
jgi:hypothetical protein